MLRIIDDNVARSQVLTRNDKHIGVDVQDYVSAPQIIAESFVALTRLQLRIEINRVFTKLVPIVACRWSVHSLQGLV